MAGHSKWANIKHRKGRQDTKRGVLFSKLSRAITVAAKMGGPDPDSNATLAQAIQAAKDVVDAQGQHRARDRQGCGRPPTPSNYEHARSTRATAPTASR